MLQQSLNMNLSTYPKDFIFFETSSEAEPKSLQSDPTKQIQVYHPHTAFQNIAAFGTLMFLQKESYWMTDMDTKYFANLCYRYNYEGKWEILQKILEKTTNFQEFELITIELLGASTYYGNLMDLMKIYKKMFRYIDPEHRHGKIKRKVRRRGYNDKGTLRPSYKKYRNLGEETDSRKDYRNRIAHPLLKNFLTGVEVPSGRISQREEKDYQKGGKEL